MRPEPLPPSSPLPAACAFHSELAASISCARCGTFACHACHTLASDGQPYCVRCLSKQPQLRIADRGTRFVANLVDSIILYGSMFVAMFIGGMLAQPHAEDPDTGGVIAVVLILFTIVAALLLQLGFQVTYGQSVGKRMMRLRVVRSDGSRPSVMRIIFARNLALGAVSAIVGFVGLIDALLIFGEKRRCLHDMIADTDVIAE